MFWVYSGKESVSQNIGCLFHSTTFLLLSSDFVFWDSLVFGSKYSILCVKVYLQATDSKYVQKKRLENSVFCLQTWNQCSQPLFVSYPINVFHLVSNFHQIIFVNSRVMSRSHCPKSFCFYRSTSLTVYALIASRSTSSTVRIYFFFSILKSLGPHH